MKISITYLYHSGFIVETSECIMVFDYHKDSNNILDNMIKENSKDLHFFVSHKHSDHFNFEIAKYSDRAKLYFLHSECKLFNVDKSKIVSMSVFDSFENDLFKIKMYGSTDIGGSYFVKLKNCSLFHAGDLNWWHWASENNFYNTKARENFFEEIKNISQNEKEVDFAFFPVDSRLEIASEWGIKYFLDQIKVKHLVIPMHMSGKKWIPSYEFKWKYKNMNVWIPSKEGDLYKGE